ncbi:hypothetical protein BH10PSE17_BH10PSE17_27490 [soil metagenome]
MKSIRSQTIEGQFIHVIYAPKGEIEGVLLAVDGASVQVVVDKHDPDAGLGFSRLSPGQRLRLQVETQPPSTKGRSEHPIYAMVALESVDGAKPLAPPSTVDEGYQGKVIRFNYAKHGEPNGVVLDSGDFIHTRPDGLARLKLQVGQSVVAIGDAQRLFDDSGWAVEADSVNGQSL